MCMHNTENWNDYLPSTLNCFLKILLRFECVTQAYMGQKKLSLCKYSKLNLAEKDFRSFIAFHHDTWKFNFRKEFSKKASMEILYIQKPSIKLIMNDTQIPNGRYITSFWCKYCLRIMSWHCPFQFAASVQIIKVTFRLTIGLLQINDVECCDVIKCLLWK